MILVRLGNYMPKRNIEDCILVLYDKTRKIEEKNKDLERLIMDHIMDRSVLQDSNSSLLKYPYFLQRTYRVLQSLKEPSDANSISKITGIVRAVESHYLRLLEVNGDIGSIRKGRHKYYFINNVVEEKKEINPLVQEMSKAQ